MNYRKITLSTSLALFIAAFLIFFFTLLNGYGLNLIGGYKADARLVVAGLIVEMLALVWIARRWIAIERDPLELAGFLLVVAGVWIYFVAASAPTFLPPTLSNDAVRVYLQALFSFPEGKLVSWYPAGGAFVVAMLARWIGWDPLRVLHLTAAAFIALSAGATYGMTRALLRGNRFSQIFALAAPAFLFVPWTYFAGMIDWEQYFFAQAFAQYFILAALWFTARYTEEPSWQFAVLFGAALLGIVAAYPYFVPLALAMFVFSIIFVFPLARFGRGAGMRVVLLSLAIFVALVLLAAVAIQRGGILEIAAAGRLATVSGVGEDGVTNPSLDNLGGPLFLLLAFAGIPFAWRAGASGRVLLALLAAWLLQLIGLVVLQPFLQISDYRLDKTFYILVFPFAMLATIFLAKILQRTIQRVRLSSRATAGAMLTAALMLGAAVAIFRPPKFFAPFTESELQAAQWAKQNLNTYEIAYLDPLPIRAYWLAFGIWRETIPNEWFQWIPAGTKLGPPTFDEWLTDPAWQRYLLVRDSSSARGASVLHQIGDSAIVEKNIPPRVEPTPQFRAPWFFGTTIRFIGYDLAANALTRGTPFGFTTFTESIYPPPATVLWRAELVDRVGNVIAKSERDPFANKYPVQRFPPGAIARDDWTMPVDANAAPGAYDLRLGLYRRENGEPIGVWHASESQAVHKKFLNAAPVARLKIPVAPPGAEELHAATSLDARVGDNFLLARYALAYDRATRRARLTLYWRGIAKTADDYTVFAHWLDAAGKIIAQQDAEPLNGNYPTSLWDAGEIVREDYEFVFPGDAAPQSVEIGMYAQPSLSRLPVFDATGARMGDRIDLPVE